MTKPLQTSSVIKASAGFSKDCPIADSKVCPVYSSINVSLCNGIPGVSSHYPGVYPYERSEPLYSEVVI